MRPEATGTGEVPQRRGEGCVAVEPVGVVTGGGQELAGGFGADTAAFEQRGRGLGGEGAQLGVGVGDLSR